MTVSFCLNRADCDRYAGWVSGAERCSRRSWRIATTSARSPISWTWPRVRRRHSRRQSRALPRVRARRPLARADPKRAPRSGRRPRNSSCAASGSPRRASSRARCSPSRRPPATCSRRMYDTLDVSVSEAEQWAPGEPFAHRIVLHAADDAVSGDVGPRERRDSWRVPPLLGRGPLGRPRGAHCPSPARRAHRRPHRVHRGAHARPEWLRAPPLRHERLLRHVLGITLPYPFPLTANPMLYPFPLTPNPMLYPFPLTQPQCSVLSPTDFPR